MLLESDRTETNLAMYLLIIILPLFARLHVWLHDSTEACITWRDVMLRVWHGRWNKAGHSCTCTCTSTVYICPSRCHVGTRSIFHHVHNVYLLLLTFSEAYNTGWLAQTSHRMQDGAVDNLSADTDVPEGSVFSQWGVLLTIDDARHPCHRRRFPVIISQTQHWTQRVTMLQTRIRLGNDWLAVYIKFNWPLWLRSSRLKTELPSRQSGLFIAPS